MIASTLDHLISEMDLEAVLSGYIIVRRNSVEWSQTPEEENSDVLGNYALGELESSEVLKLMAETGMSDVPGMNLVVDQIVLDIVRDLEDSSSAFRKLQ